MSTQLLIDEYPLIVLPSLVKAVGLEKAIILQQVHYWMKKSTHERDGHLWIYNSYRAWAEQLSWMSEEAIRKHIKALEKRGLLVSANYNKLAMDKTKWYRIDYEALANLIQSSGAAVLPIRTPSPHPEADSQSAPVTIEPQRLLSKKDTTDVSIVHTQEDNPRPAKNINTFSGYGPSPPRCEGGALAEQTKVELAQVKRARLKYEADSGK